MAASSSGIGSHEARIPTIPTIATIVPRAAFARVTPKTNTEFTAAGIDTPLVASNRINAAEVAAQLLFDGAADMVSLARPLLAVADFVAKAARGQSDLINTCIACKQACLDHVFQNKLSNSLVNPCACRDTELVFRPTATARPVAMVGAGRIGFDVAEYLGHGGTSTTLALPAWQGEWGVTEPALAPGDLSPEPRHVSPPARQVTLLLVKAGKLGTGLDKTTGWIDRSALKLKNVQMMGDVDYGSDW